MQNPLEKSPGKQDERAKGMEDSPMMTIEYLRARLHAERSVSKTAKERADELAKRVSELEEQLKVVTLQRKRSEKATLDVLSFLATHGISDISEVYESESDEEESLCESSVGKCDPTKEEENFGSSEIGQDKEFSGSDHESSRSSSRSLSWKGRKKSAQNFEKKSFDPSFRRQTSLTQFSSSPRHRSGKSCRQIKRREFRCAVEESRHDSTETDAQDNKAVNSLDNLANCLGTGNEGSERSSEKRIQRIFHKNDASLSSLARAQECDVSSAHKHEYHGRMERALEHQAHFIGCYEAQEKAQRDWEEKYEENNISTPDSCEPGNHSDITEERDENKATVPRPTKVVPVRGHDQRAGIQTHFHGKEPSVPHFDSFNFTVRADAGSAQNHNIGEMKASISSPPDFAFSVVNSNHTQDHGASLSFQSSTQNSPIVTSCSASSFCEFEPPEDLNRHRALVVQETHKPGAVLEALHEAKSLIKQQMNCFPEASGSVRKAIATPDSTIRDGDWFKVHVGCPGLFRVPADFQSQASQIRLLGSGYSSSPIPRPVIGTEPDISDRQSRFGFHFNTSQPSSSKSTFPSYSSVPFPRVSPNQMSSGPVMSEAGISSSGSRLYYDDNRPNVYR